MNVQKVILLFIIGLLAGSCSEEARKQFEPRPVAFGPLNQLVVVADASVWEGPVGDSLDYYFGGPYPILPQPEPIYDIKHFTPEELISLKERRELRAYVFLADVSNSNSKTTQLIEEDLGNESLRDVLNNEKGYKTSIGKDKWADGQVLVYMLGNSPKNLIENIRKNFAGVNRRIREADERKISSTVYLEGTNNELQADVKNKLGVTIKLPADFVMATFAEEERTLWLRQETDEVSTNILLQKMPYTDEKQLTKEGMKSIRDSLGQLVSTRIPNTYMKINDIDLPMLVEGMTFNNYFALEARGIWEIENDFMGGPFVSYLLLNPTTNELLFVDGFIHAPGKEKREFMQYLEHILRSIKF